MHQHQPRRPLRKRMPKRQPPKNKTWVQLTQDFVKEWPEVLEGLQFQNMPVKYLLYIDIILKNNLTIHYDIAKELKTKKQETIARFLRKTIEDNYLKIRSVDMKFDIPALKRDMQSRTSLIMAKTFKK
jgi:homoserine trans-succinylase